MANIKEIAFIDAAVSTIETLIEGLRSEVVALSLHPGRSRDGRWRALAMIINRGA